MSTMKNYEFTLTFKFHASDSDVDKVVERLGAAGCTDALVGIGRDGYVALGFSRQSTSREEAIRLALADVRTAIPTAELL
ncbi:hypothetical protein [Herbaspirillum seropedicae]|uniref:hypothetical protein n=1 Tax=Herbaspirillum seropedicae TaxID=964 RepID=UPI00084820CC|nr:hypothetical protein [Herbaspirillum seropedicae]